MTDLDGTKLVLRAEPAHISGNAMREALKALTPAHQAQNGSLVMITRNFYSDAHKNSLPEPREVQAWQSATGRLMPCKLCSMKPEDRQAAALPYALMAETDAATGVVLRARRLIKLRERNTLLLAALPGAAVVARWSPDLALGNRTGLVALLHLTENMAPFIEKDLSNHARIEAMAGLERVLSDFATWGATGRHFFEEGMQEPPARRVRVRL